MEQCWSPEETHWWQGKKRQLRQTSQNRRGLRSHQANPPGPPPNPTVEQANFQDFGDNLTTHAHLAKKRTSLQQPLGQQL